MKQDVQFIHRRGDVKVAKGMKKSVINNDLKFSNYMECLMEEETMEHSYDAFGVISTAIIL